MSTAPNEQALAVVVAWLDAMRRGDLEAVASGRQTVVDPARALASVRG